MYTVISQLTVDALCLLKPICCMMQYPSFGWLRQVNRESIQLSVSCGNFNHLCVAQMAVTHTASTLLMTSPVFQVSHNSGIQSY